jgi:hypothetical protein
MAFLSVENFKCLGTNLTKQIDFIKKLRDELVLQLLALSIVAQFGIRKYKV